MKKEHDSFDLEGEEKVDDSIIENNLTKDLIFVINVLFYKMI